MTRERIEDSNPAQSAPGEGADFETPPLHLKDSAERLPLIDRLHVLLHNVRAERLGDLDAEEMEAVKNLSDTGTQELKLPRVLPKPPSEKSGRELSENEKEAQARREADRRYSRIQERASGFARKLDRGR